MIYAGENLLREAAQVTYAFAMVFILATSYQIYAKFAAQIRHNRSKKDSSDNAKVEPFNRYASSDSSLVAADRCVGNLLEWSLPFLTLFWLSVVFAGEGIQLGWIYVLFRAVYIVVVALGGIDQGGAKPLILVATIPSYICLIGLGMHTYRTIF